MKKKLELTKENMAGIAIYTICLITILIFIASRL